MKKTSVALVCAACVLLPLSIPTVSFAVSANKYRMACDPAYVVSDPVQRLVYKPRQCGFVGDSIATSSGYLKLRWSRWGNIAKATGLIRPQKSFDEPRKMTLTLSNPQPCVAGLYSYRKAVLRTRGRSYNVTGPMDADQKCRERAVTFAECGSLDYSYGSGEWSFGTQRGGSNVINLTVRNGSCAEARRLSKTFEGAGAESSYDCVVQSVGSEGSDHRCTRTNDDGTVAVVRWQSGS